MQVKTIVGHSIWEFLNEVQEAVLEGFRLSEKSEYFPYTTGPLSVVHLVKEENEHSEEEDSTQDGSTQEDEISESSVEYLPTVAESVEYNPDLVALADIVDIAEQSGAAIPPVEKKKPGRKAKA